MDKEVHLKFTVILAHPNPKSFNHAIADRVVKVLTDRKQEVYFHDLYAEHFDPILPFEEFDDEAIVSENIASYCHELIESEGIVIVHPNWWGQPPAILKGWVDRVIRPGVAYRFLEGDQGEGIPIGLLKAKAAVVLNTSNTPHHREIEVFGDPLERLWKDCIFSLCGIKYFERRMFKVIVTSTERQRKDWLDEVEQIVEDVFL